MQHPPDLVVLDLFLGKESGLTLCKWIKKVRPDIKVVVLSAHVDSLLVTHALKMGVDGYLLKAIDGQAFCDALQRIAAGHRVLDDSATESLCSQAHFKAGRVAFPDVLNEQDKRIVQGVAKGWVNKEIAAQLHLSEKTIKNAITRIHKKLQLSSRAQLMAYYLKNSAHFGA